jgi:hypothetical protein
MSAIVVRDIVVVAIACLVLAVPAAYALLVVLTRRDRRACARRGHVFSGGVCWSCGAREGEQ